MIVGMEFDLISGDRVDILYMYIYICKIYRYVNTHIHKHFSYIT